MSTALLESPRDLDQSIATIRVRASEQGGWDVRVEREGQPSIVEHYTDWHRVERRRAILEILMRPLARIALVLVAVIAIAGPAAAQDEAPGLLPEPRLLERGIAFVDMLKGDDTAANAEGFYADLGHMISGAGWLSLGPGYRYRLFDERALIDASTAISWRTYKAAQARFELPALADDHVTLGTQVLWQDLTQVTYYGAGPDSLESARSDYRLKSSNVVAYATVRPSRAVAVTGRVGWLSRPGLSSSTGPFDRGVADTRELFAADPGVGLARQPGFSHADVALSADTRDHRGHPTSGGLYRAAWVGFRDRDGANFTFERYETEGAHFLPVIPGRSVLALHGWAVFSPTADGRNIPFYLLPSLGGSNTLRSYADYRFHDRNLLVLNAESRWSVLTHLDGALFFDAGNVAARPADLNLARTSYGAGLRLHTGTSTIARFDAARGREGWRLSFRLNEPLRLARLARRTAAIPFVP